MKNYDISIIIPARSEMFLSHTVQDILEHKKGKTEVIAVMDGEWANPAVSDHDDVRVIYLPKAIGQRAATNLGVKMSNAQYIIKCDAHCAFDDGFDVKMLEAFRVAGDNAIIVPIMRNLHVFDWVCKKCGNRWYQGPTPTHCLKTEGKKTVINEKCDNTTEFVRDMRWIGKQSPQSRSFCFDSEPHFQYFNEYTHRPEYQKVLAETGLTETMSIQGSFFMIPREKYLELNICDEAFGSWGSQGIETACKMWLSGGRVLCNHNTWYAHLFRTQGGDFSFPYPHSQTKTEYAKKFARDLFFNNKWDKQIHPLSWLIEKFWPVQGWTDKDLAELKKKDAEFYANHKKELLKEVLSVSSVVIPEKKEPTKGIIYYTPNDLQLSIARAVQDQLRKISKEKNIPIVSCSLKPMSHFGDKNIHFHGKRGYLTMFKQILTALENSDADIIFHCEHDMLYSHTHFDFTPPCKDKFYYNQNFWRVRMDTEKALHWDANQVSGLVAYRDLLIDFYRKRIADIEKNGFNRSYEPGGRDKSLYETWKSESPNVDVRHPGTLTRDKLSPADFRDKSTCVNWQEGECPAWAKDIVAKIRKSGK